MTLFIEVSEIADGWEALVKKIVENGKEVHDERGSLTLELLNTVVTIKKPTGYLNDLKAIRIPEGCFWAGERLKEYSNQFLSKDRQGFVYTYGNRLRAHFEGIDQVQEAIERLKKL